MNVDPEIADPHTAGQRVRWRRRLFLMLAIGFSLSALLAVLEALGHSVVWMNLQVPGFVLGEAIWRLDAGENAFEALMIVTNGAFYSVCILIAIRGVSTGPTDQAENPVRVTLSPSKLGCGRITGRSSPIPLFA